MAPSSVRLILASQSPRRRELLALLGFPFEATAADVPEIQLAGETPAGMAARLSHAKAEAVAPRYPDGLILGCDTVVADGPLALGKPADAAEARAMLRSLRGRSHDVYSSISMLEAATGRVAGRVERTLVHMRNYSDDEIETYIASSDPFDKAGAYAIQHPGFHPVAALSGCYINVMGLPLCCVTDCLREWGLEPPSGITAACRPQIDYRCLVYQHVQDRTGRQAGSRGTGEVE